MLNADVCTEPASKPYDCQSLRLDVENPPHPPLENGSELSPGVTIVLFAVSGPVRVAFLVDKPAQKPYN